MGTEIILAGKGEDVYHIAIYKKEKFVNGKLERKFYIRVFDIRQSKSDDDWIAETIANTEEEAREVMNKFYKKYYPKGE